MRIKVFANDTFSPVYDTELKKVSCDMAANCFVCPVIKHWNSTDFDCVEFIINKLEKEGLL